MEGGLSKNSEETSILDVGRKPDLSGTKTAILYPPSIKGFLLLILYSINWKK